MNRRSVVISTSSITRQRSWSPSGRLGPPHGVDGTSSSEHSRQRPGDGVSPGVLSGANITLSRRKRAEPTQGLAGRTGSGAQERAASPFGRQEGWYRGTRSAPRRRWSLVPSAKLPEPKRRGRRTTVSEYRPVPPQVDLPALEHEVHDFWRDEKIFEKSLDRAADRPRWTFYEGPPTANGKPGTHHVEARVFKDLFPRFKTMQGHMVERKAGWDCHGLPVELAVEKELGFSGKGGIEAYGGAEFNARCRESVLRNVALFEAMTTRMGYWVDMTHPYTTMSSSYVESVWWALQQIHDKGLLVEDHRVAPYCPR